MLEIKRILNVRQEGRTDCGIACMQCVLIYYGNSVPKEYLHRITSFDGNGVTMYGIKRAFEELGFCAEGERGDLREKESIIVPFIAHLALENGNHYVVVYRFNKKEVQIMDPATGKRKMKITSFLEQATGNYLFIRPTSHMKEIMLNKTIRKYLFEFFRKRRFFYFVFFILLIVSFLFDLSSLFQLKILLNHAIIPGMLENLKILFSLFFLLLVGKTASMYLLGSFQTRTLYFLEIGLRKKVLKHVLTLPYLYYKTCEKGKFMTLFQDIDFISQFIATQVFSFFTAFFYLSFFSFYFYFTSIYCFLFLVFSSIFFFFFLLLEKNGLKKGLHKFHERKTSFHTQLSAIFHFVDTIKGSHLEQNFFKQLKTSSSMLEQTRLRLEKRKQKEKIVLSFLDGSIYLLFLAFLSFLLLKKIKVKNLGNFLLLEGFLATALKMEKEMMLFGLSYKEFKIAMNRLDELFYVKGELLLPHAKFKNTTTYQIECQNLSYCYGLQPVLKHVTFHIEGGSHIFVYGVSGSGKSTLFKLLGRYLEPLYGMISIGGRDITHYNLETLREMVCYISSEILLENGSLEHNITLSKKRRVNLEKILWVSGLDEVLKRRGSTLYTIEDAGNYSSGEKARIALARALYRDSKIYLFDECFSTLDIKSEKTVLKRLFEKYQDKTILYISHRVDSKELFDQIFYLKKGGVYAEK